MPTNKLVEENRIGKFAVSRRLIFDSDDTALRALFGKMIIIDAKTDFQSDSVEYIAYSPLFRPTPRSTEPPWYRIWVEVEDGEKLSFRSLKTPDRWDANCEILMNFGELSPN